MDVQKKANLEMIRRGFLPAISTKGIETKKIYISKNMNTYKGNKIWIEKCREKNENMQKRR